MKYDLVIIGAGPGGYEAAIKGAQHGLKVLLVEKDALGGTCLNRGCIPTKSLIYDSKLFRAARTSPVLAGGEGLTVDPAGLLGRKRQVVKTLVGGLGGLLPSHGVEVVKGRGQLLAPGRVMVTNADGTSREYQAHNVILATGSRPATLPFIAVDGRLVQTTDEALDCETLPQKLVIIGGGVIGVEMATIYLNLGCEVTILELLPDILIHEDGEVRKTMRSLLKQRGAMLHLQAKARQVVASDQGVQVSFEDQAGSLHTLATDRVLVAIGRTPVMDGIDTKALGLATDGPFVKVDNRLRTNLPGVYAIGDLVGGMMLAHKAAAEAETVVETILGGGRPVIAERIPRCIWGPAEIGAIGLSEEQARAAGRKVRTGRFPYRNSGAALALGDTHGFVKIVGDAETGEILGVHILGEHATDLIAEAATAMTMEAAVEDLAAAIRPHPTLSETILEAARDWNGLAVHSPGRKGR
jgi:dihydrolipoamide dehydrogenase